MLQYKVYVIVDREFGQRLSELEQGIPIWIVGTPKNKHAAEQVWAKQKDHDHLTGVTSFTDIPSALPEDLLVAELDTIDLHHGSYSTDPPYSAIEVIGASISVRVKTELARLGFDDFRETAAGFIATRPLPSD